MARRTRGDPSALDTAEDDEQLYKFARNRLISCIEWNSISIAGPGDAPYLVWTGNQRANDNVVGMDHKFTNDKVRFTSATLHRDDLQKCMAHGRAPARAHDSLLAAFRRLMCREGWIRVGRFAVPGHETLLQAIKRHEDAQLYRSVQLNQVAPIDTFQISNTRTLITVYEGHSLDGYYMTWDPKSPGLGGKKVAFTHETSTRQDFVEGTLYKDRSKAGHLELLINPWRSGQLLGIVVNEKWARVGSFAIPREELQSALKRHKDRIGPLSLSRGSIDLLRVSATLHKGELAILQVASRTRGRTRGYSNSGIVTNLAWRSPAQSRPPAAHNTKRVQLLPGTEVDAQILMLGYSKENIISELERHWYRTGEYLVPPNVYQDFHKGKSPGQF